MWFETVGFAETGKSLIVKVFWRNESLRGLSIFLVFYFCSWLGVSHWRERISVAMDIRKKRKHVWRRRIYRKYVSWNRLQKMQDEIYADIILSRSHGSAGQWFPETEYLCASTIFVVGTSGIPPNLNYRNVKSYNTMKGNVFIPIYMLMRFI